MIVGFVTEGPTDVPILAAVVRSVFGEIEVRPIQPPVDALGEAAAGGYSELEKWCKKRGHTLEYALWDIDLLVVHIDADRCPVYQVETTTHLCDRVKDWLGPASTLNKLVIVVPAQASEAWLVAAHLPTNPALESRNHPEDALAERRLVARNAEGQPVKDTSVYEELAQALHDRLGELRWLPELDRFVRKLERFKGRATA